MPDQVLTDSGDVKYRVGRLKKPLEGNDAKNGVLFKVGDLGIPDKTGKAKWSFNHVLFPTARPDASSVRKASTTPNDTPTAG